jgi:PASTA domain
MLWLALSGTATATASPTATLTATSTSTQLTPAATAILTWGQTLTALLIMGVVLLAAGAVVIWARQQAGSRAAAMAGTTGSATAPDSDKGSAAFEVGASVVRSWIAISLVIGLLLFCALTFAVPDTTLRSTLIGALTASVGSAIAYYFSTKSAEQARQDLMTTIAGSEVVPDLHGMNAATAATTLGKTSLKLEINPPGSKDPTATVLSQNPNRGVSAPKGSSVQVTMATTPDPTQSQTGPQPQPQPQPPPAPQNPADLQVPADLQIPMP